MDTRRSILRQTKPGDLYAHAPHEEAQDSVIPLPPPSPQSKPHVSAQAWRVALYASTTSLGDVLGLLGAYVAEKSKGIEFISSGMPALRVHPVAAQYFPSGLPEPWTFEPMGSPLPHIFDAAPMRGKRHIMLQVERNADEDVYTITFFGGIWSFRAAFDNAEVRGGYVEAEDGTREYVRCLPDMKADEAGKERLANLLAEGVLRGHAVCLLDETGDSNCPMRLWLAARANVFHR